MTVSSLAAPVRTLLPVAPFTLALTGENRAEGKAGLGQPGRSPARSNAYWAMLSPCWSRSTACPRIDVAPQILVAGDKSEFELPLSFASTVKAGS